MIILINNYINLAFNYYLCIQKWEFNTVIFRHININTHKI